MSDEVICKTEAKLAEQIEPLGLSVFGWFRLDEVDLPCEPRRKLAASFDGLPVGALIGNRAENGRHRMWEVFAQSEEFADAALDPMDLWTHRVLSPIAGELGAAAIFPFGDDLWPFQRFAKQATAMQPSPIGLLIHPEHGLWQTFRAVFLFPDIDELPKPEPIRHPCHSCDGQPCLTACPVDAFSGEGFAVSLCRNHLSSASDPDCMAIGCRARAACPVGKPYTEEQVRFHMKAFGDG